VWHSQRQENICDRCLLSAGFRFTKRRCIARYKDCGVVAGVERGLTMSVSYDADLIILGGGCAGLSLARNMAASRTNMRTLILEAREKYSNDRTWCFWERPQHANAHLVRHQWAAWQFSTHGQEAVQRSRDEVRYQCVPADVFYDDALGTIEASDAVSLNLGVRVDSVANHADHALVETCRGRLNSRWVVDTRPPDWGRHSDGIMQQVFAGSEVRTSKERFDPSLAGLMTSMRVDELGFRFTYALPFSTRQALIEETRFSTKDVSRQRLTSDLNATLTQLVDGDDFETIRREAGWIPMTTNGPREPQFSRVFSAGTTGGAVRASSGYAFLRIQKWADACTAQLASGSGPMAHPRDPPWRRFIDGLFLRVVIAEPELAPQLFMCMGQHLSARTMVRFLSDDCRPADFVKVASVLPKRPFLRALLPSWRQGK
jgi:lycopene beta-cyclase